MLTIATGKDVLEDSLGIKMVINNDVLLPTAGTNMETASSICVEFSDMAFQETKFVGGD